MFGIEGALGCGEVINEISLRTKYDISPMNAFPFEKASEYPQNHHC
jgi:hypothetical protein